MTARQNFNKIFDKLYFKCLSRLKNSVSLVPNWVYLNWVYLKSAEQFSVLFSLPFFTRLSLIHLRRLYNMGFRVPLVGNVLMGSIVMTSIVSCALISCSGPWIYSTELTSVKLPSAFTIRDGTIHDEGVIKGEEPNIKEIHKDEQIEKVIDSSAFIEHRIDEKETKNGAVWYEMLSPHVFVTSMKECNLPHNVSNEALHRQLSVGIGNRSVLSSEEIIVKDYELSKMRLVGTLDGQAVNFLSLLHQKDGCAVNIVAWSPEAIEIDSIQPHTIEELVKLFLTSSTSSSELFSFGSFSSSDSYSRIS